MVPPLPFRLLRARFRVEGAYHPRDPVGSDLRGALGRLWWEKDGEDWRLRPVGRVPDDLSSLDPRDWPQEYVARAPTPASLPAGGELACDVVLFGADEERAKTWEALMRGLPDVGLGRSPHASLRCEEVMLGRLRRLDEYVERRWHNLAPRRATRASLQLELLTTTRLNRRGDPRRPTVSDVVCSLSRRLRRLDALYGSGGVDSPGPSDPARADSCDLDSIGLIDGDLIAAALSEDPAPHLRFVESRRMNRRQEQWQPMDGWVGHLRGHWPAPLARLLLAGEIVHIGRGTTFGRGRIKLSAWGSTAPG